MRQSKVEPNTAYYHIVDAKTEDFPQLISIANIELGDDYMQTLYNSISSFLRIAINEDSKVWGFCYLYMKKFSIIQEELGLPEPFCDPEELVGSLKTVAVLGKVQGSGIGSSLVKDALNHFQSNGIHNVFCTAWNSKHMDHFSRILRQYQFKVLTRINNYWHMDSIQKGYQCPECGNPCNCSATIYHLSL